jgi:RNA polymerase sigma factor (sigma-70 family)
VLAKDVGVGHLGNLSDDELLALTAKDPEAFGVFYERHVRLVMGYLVGETRDTERALDLTAEVFAAALAGARRFRPGGPPASAWLIGIARNKLAAARRREAVAFAARKKLGIPLMSFDEEEIERVEQIVDAAGAGYLDALATLPEPERDAVNARVLEERDYPDIAAAQGASQAAIRQRAAAGWPSWPARGEEGHDHQDGGPPDAHPQRVGGGGSTHESAPQQAARARPGRPARAAARGHGRRGHRGPVQHRGPGR